MHYLAECYRYGEGVKRRNASAVELYTRAAGRGYVLSQRDLGLAILEGRLGMEADGVEGAKWLRKAASQGDRIACSKLGLAYAEGLGGLERDDERAERYLVRAAEAYKKSEQSSRSSATVRESGSTPLHPKPQTLEPTLSMLTTIHWNHESPIHVESFNRKIMTLDRKLLPSTPNLVTYALNPGTWT